MTLEQRCKGDDIAGIVKSLRMNPPEQTDPEQKKLIKLLGKKTCPSGLLMWAALCGSIEMKQSVAKNPSINQLTCDALIMDAEQAPWYVFTLLENEAVFVRFMQDIYGIDCPYPDALTVNELFDETETCYQEDKWKELIPEQGECEILQAELIRILWRFGRTLNYGVAYTVDYDDEMFIVLNAALDRITEIGLFGRNVLRAFLRWSQIIQRGSDSKLPESNYIERYYPVNIVVDVFLRKFSDPIPFDKRGMSRSVS
jgi:hypothetical protein